MRSIIFLGFIFLMGCDESTVTQGESSPEQVSAAVTQVQPVNAVAMDNPYFLILSSQNEVWAGSVSPEGGVSRFSVDGTLIARIDTGPSAIGLAEDSNGFIWVAEFDNRQISKIDPSTNLIVQSIPTGVGPYGLYYHQGFLYATIQSDDEVIKIDIVTGEIVASVPVGTAPHNMTVANGLLYVANELSQDIDVIDLSCFGVVDRIVTGGYMVNVAVADTGQIFGTGYADNSVFVIDETIKRVPISLAMGLIKDGDKMVVTSSLNSALVEFDFCGEIIRTDLIAGASSIRNLVRVGTDLWVAGFTSDKIYVVPW